MHIIPDGYNQPGYVAEFPRLHPELRFRYRPMLHTDRDRITGGLAGKSPDFKLIYESWQKFLADSNLWFRIAENTLDNYRFAMSAQPR